MSLFSRLLFNYYCIINSFFFINYDSTRWLKGITAVHSDCFLWTRPEEEPAVGRNQSTTLHFVILFLLLVALNNKDVVTTVWAECELAWSQPRCILFPQILSAETRPSPHTAAQLSGTKRQFSSLVRCILCHRTATAQLLPRGDCRLGIYIKLFVKWCGPWCE